MKSSGQLSFGKEKPKKVFERFRVLPSKVCITWHKPVVCDFKIKKFEARKKIGTLHEDSVKCDFMSYTNLYRASQKDASVEGSVEMSRKKRC